MSIELARETRRKPLNETVSNVVIIIGASMAFGSIFTLLAIGIPWPPTTIHKLLIGGLGLGTMAIIAGFPVRFEKGSRLLPQVAITLPVCMLMGIPTICVLLSL